MNFKPAPILKNEKQRLIAVERSAAMYKDADSLYEIYCHLAKEISNCPVSWAGLIDDENQYCIASDGLPDEMDKKIPRQETFCQYAINNQVPLIVSNMSKDLRFKFHPAVKNNLVKFYAAFPIISKDGYVLGTLCVSDNRVRVLSKNKVQLLKNLAQKISYQLEIQENFRNKNAETIIEVLDKISNKVENLSINNVKIILKYFSNQILNENEKSFLIDNNLCSSKHNELKITPFGNELKNELSLNIGILKRMQNIVNDESALDNLFNELRSK